MPTTELEMFDVETNAQDVTELLDRVATDPAARIEVLNKLLGEGACRHIGIYPLPAGFKLSVVIPVYNEERWLAELVRRVQAVPRRDRQGQAG
jgi:DNA-binding Lrp family transcriptional regulator